MFCCKIKKNDDVIWLKYLPLDIQEHCMQFKRGQKFSFLINNKRMHFTWMNDGSDGRPTLGIKATTESKENWNSIPRGTIIIICIPNENILIKNDL